MVEIIKAIAMIIWLILSGMAEKDKEKKAEKEKVRSDLSQAIKDRDNSRINAIISRIGRL